MGCFSPFSYLFPGTDSLASLTANTLGGAPFIASAFGVASRCRLEYGATTSYRDGRPTPRISWSMLGIHGLRVALSCFPVRHSVRSRRHGVYV